ncbi:MAG TPA: hypothetical protein VNA32_10380 [Actinomycetota bacterium]|nr:hypothetical protein [Actinomycetota bacterium]
MIPILDAYHGERRGYPAGCYAPTKITNTTYTWHFAIRTRHRASQLIATLSLSVSLVILATHLGDATAAELAAWEREMGMSWLTLE